MTRLLRYGLASLGPVGSAGAQFLLSLVVLHACSAATFGSFSILLVSSQLTLGLGSALFCAPLLVLMTRGHDPRREPAVDAIFGGNLLFSILVGIIFLAIGGLLRLPMTIAALFAVYAGVAVLRWFGRAHAYAGGRQVRTIASDLVYSAVLLGGCAAAHHDQALALPIACIALAVSASFSLIPFGRAFLASQFLHVRPGHLAAYRGVWRDYSGWTILGVVTTELTANCHSYLVTLFFGPVAFAPIAATQLMIRPITISSNALAEFERAQMARSIGQGEVGAAVTSLRLFRLALGLIWLATAVATVLLLTRAPWAIFPRRYPLDLLTTGAALWTVVAGARALRAPDSALLQAAGSFRPLAMASVYACTFSIAAVLLLLATATPLWSILGILAGELVFAGWTWEMARRWIRSQRARSDAGAARSGPVRPHPSPDVDPPACSR